MSLYVPSGFPFLFCHQVKSKYISQIRSHSISREAMIEDIIKAGSFSTEMNGLIEATIKQ